MITFSGDCISQLPALLTWSSSVSLNKSDVEAASLTSVEIEKSSLRPQQNLLLRLKTYI